MTRAAITGFPPLMSVQAMNAEALLDDRIDPYGAEPVRSEPPDAILLTGATGFLGAFLLYELVRQTSATIHCLVRANSQEGARERIRANLESYGLPIRCADRVQPVIGDLTRPQLGIEHDTFERLSETIDAVYHSGAIVKWTYPYASLRSANVGGTHEILRLASRRRCKPVHFVSTVGVFSSPDYPAGVVLETDQLDSSGPLYVGYAQSKWVAEKLVRLAGCRGLPVSIHRPNIACHSTTGAFNPSDHLCLMIRGCIQLGCAPVWDMKFSGAAVDYVSRAIVHLGLQPESLGGTFHFVGAQNLQWNDVVSQIRERVPALRQIPFDEWRAELHSEILRSRDNALHALSPLFFDSFLECVRLPSFDCRNTLQHLAGTSIRCPTNDSAVMARMLDRLVPSGALGECGV